MSISQKKNLFKAHHFTTIIGSHVYHEDILLSFRSNCPIELLQNNNKKMEVRVVYKGNVNKIGDSRGTTMK